MLDERAVIAKSENNMNKRIFLAGIS